MNNRWQGLAKPCYYVDDGAFDTWLKEEPFLKNACVLRSLDIHCQLGLTTSNKLTVSKLSIIH